MSQEFKDVAKRAMTKSVESFVQEIAKLRSGRAHPNLLDHIKIENWRCNLPDVSLILVITTSSIMGGNPPER